MRFFTLIFSIIFSLGVMAQGRLTPQAVMKLQKAKAAITKKDGASQAPAQTVPTVVMLVKVSTENATKTYQQIRAAGGSILGKIGRQAVVEMPVDQVETISSLKGVERIDVTHKGKWKTDVTRNETGVSLIDGSDPSVVTAYTGKGVTVCLIDEGFDYQHPAFKDSEGRSRIKCVYIMSDNNGRKFTVEDPDAGTYTFPGSVYDTPELISTLTTDNKGETHGTHTAGIAAGSRSPLGFGGMAPGADIVLVPLNDKPVEGIDENDALAYLELAFSFVEAYAKQSAQPIVLSASLNSHHGPHDGTSSVTEAIEDLSQSVIPVFSAGNEGVYPIHLYQKFTNTKTSVKTLLLGLIENDDESKGFTYISDVAGYTRTGDKVGVKLTLKSLNPFTGKLTSIWSSDECTITEGGDPQTVFVSSSDDSGLAQYFTGAVSLGAFTAENGKLCVAASVQGTMTKIQFFELAISGSAGTEIDLWDELIGFGGVQYVGVSGYVDGSSDMSAGDWTSTERVISVGAYCANTDMRSYDGSVTDTSVDANPEDGYTLHDIAPFSSYGTSFNGVVQPVVCSPGTNVVSSLNSYNFTEGVSSTMQWDGHPYGAEDGTSMACPVVSGIVALWLQAKPDMTLDDIKDVMKNSSTTDSYTNKDSYRWGYGKINASKGIEYINALTGIRDVPTTSTTSDTTYDLQGRLVQGSPQRGIYIRNGRKVVVR